MKKVKFCSTLLFELLVIDIEKRLIAIGFRRIFEPVAQTKSGSRFKLSADPDPYPNFPKIRIRIRNSANGVVKEFYTLQQEFPHLGTLLQVRFKSICTQGYSMLVIML